jgi:alcohol dehydrogenase class IV
VNKETGFKRGLGGDLVTADHAVLFPRITMSMPDSVAASTGMDALAHAIESYTCKEANPITRMYSRQAFALIYPNLMKTLDDPEDLESRRALLLGSCLAGYAIYNSNTGACHAISYPLGIHHLVPHGIAIGMLIPEVMKINIEKGCNLYERLIDETHGDAAAVLDDLLNDFGPRKYLPKTLAEFGIKPKDVPELAERGMDLKPAIDANPVVFTVDDATRALASVT